jgi:hypothetical protein
MVWRVNLFLLNNLLHSSLLNQYITIVPVHPTMNLKTSWYHRLLLLISNQVHPSQPSHQPTDLNELRHARQISKQEVRPKMPSISILLLLLLQNQKLKRYSLRPRDLGWVVRVRIGLRLRARLLRSGLRGGRGLQGRLPVGRMWEGRRRVKLQRRGRARRGEEMVQEGKEGRRLLTSFHDEFWGQGCMAASACRQSRRWTVGIRCGHPLFMLELNLLFTCINGAFPDISLFYNSCQSTKKYAPIEHVAISSQHFHILRHV